MSDKVHRKLDFAKNDNNKWSVFDRTMRLFSDLKFDWSNEYVTTRSKQRLTQNIGTSTSTYQKDIVFNYFINFRRVFMEKKFCVLSFLAIAITKVKFLWAFSLFLSFTPDSIVFFQNNS